MKCAGLISILLLTIAENTANAFIPPPPMSLEERVSCSTDVFVSKIGRTCFVDSFGKPISAYSAARTAIRLRNNPVIEMDIAVTQTLMSTSNKPLKKVKFLFQLPGFGWGEVTDRAENLARLLPEFQRESGSTYVFLTEKVTLRNKRIFYASADNTFYHEPLNRKASIQSLIEDAKSDPMTKGADINGVWLN